MMSATLSGAKTGTAVMCERMNGAQGLNRTTDTAIFSRMLYQLSYLGAAGPGPGSGRFIVRLACPVYLASPSASRGAASLRLALKLLENRAYSASRPVLAAGMAEEPLSRRVWPTPAPPAVPPSVVDLDPGVANDRAPFVDFR